ncbi:biotin/lipoyl-containing protein, partial [Brevundimonas sp.]|uniref:biotin/lipoyl-containing protein n=1 Tax=Brevundimonas sp. TaxID=1871086 RepID=UPI002ABCF74F
MGRFVFKLPDVGEGTAEAELVAWHVAVGDAVEEDQLLAEIMTDKATVELTSPVSGRVTALHGEPGVMSPVGSALVEFEVEGAGNAPASDAGVTPSVIAQGRDATSPSRRDREDQTVVGRPTAAPPSPLRFHGLVLRRVGIGLPCHRGTSRRPCPSGATACPAAPRACASRGRG